MTELQDADPESDEDEIVGLYHYTTPGGLLGILDSSQLWATHPAYLNDSQELEYGLNTLSQFTGEYIEKLSQKEKEAPAGERVYSAQRRAMAIGAQSIIFNDAKFAKFLKHDAAPFISCLSRARDQLSQWRGYSRGGGYAIKFDSALLESSLRRVNKKGKIDDSGRPFLVQVSYDANWLKNVMGSSLDEFCESGAKLLPVDKLPMTVEDFDLELFSKLINDLMTTVLLIASRAKNNNFEEEREFRIYDSVEETFCTPSTIGLIPRTAFHFDSRAVQEILVGPGEFSDVKKLSIERYLRRNAKRYPNVEVTLSEVPYRDI